MFGSNVQPRLKKAMRSVETWVCLHCGRENRHYLSKCPECGQRRDG